jgi:hypothetical protein
MSHKHVCAEGDHVQERARAPALDSSAEATMLCFLLLPLPLHPLSPSSSSLQGNVVTRNTKGDEMAQGGSPRVRLMTGDGSEVEQVNEVEREWLGPQDWPACTDRPFPPGTGASLGGGVINPLKDQ